jgi:hypothetical protein
VVFVFWKFMGCSNVCLRFKRIEDLPTPRPSGRSAASGSILHHTP